MKGELSRSIQILKREPVSPYFLSYEITEDHSVSVAGSFGAITRSSENRRRQLDIDLRVGDYSLDNTHPIRGSFPRFYSRRYSFVEIPIEDNDGAIRSILWYHTDKVYKQAIEQLTRVKTNVQVKVAEEDKADDFSHEPPENYLGKPVAVAVDRRVWEEKVRKYTAPFAQYGESPSDHSTISRTRRLIDVATHEAVFDWVLKRIGASGLLRGKTIGIDATTLEANAALRSIVRRDSEQGYEEFLMELAKASGIETPRREDLAKLDRKRTGKGSNRVWKHPHDADARITRMKDGRTHLAHKAEHAVDLETGAIVSVTVQGADQGDTQTMVKTLTEAAEKVEQALPEGRGIEEVVADKGYHSTQRMVDLDAVGLRSYVSEPRRGKRRWRGDRQGQEAVYAISTG